MTDPRLVELREEIAAIVRESVNEALAAAGMPIRCDVNAPITLTKADKIIALIEGEKT